MSDILPYIISACIGIGLAAASGFRVFLPFFFCEPCILSGLDPCL